MSWIFSPSKTILWSLVTSPCLGVRVYKFLVCGNKDCSIHLSQSWQSANYFKEGIPCRYVTCLLSSPSTVELSGSFREISLLPLFHVPSAVRYCDFRCPHLIKFKFFNFTVVLFPFFNRMKSQTVCKLTSFSRYFNSRTESHYRITSWWPCI